MHERTSATCGLLAGLAGTLLLAGSGQATTLDLRWSGTTGTGALGGPSIAVSGTTVETLTLDLVLQADAAGVSAFFVSLRFDTDLGNELDILSFAESTWASPSDSRFMFNINAGIQSTQESETGIVEGQLFTFEAATFGNGVSSASMLAGRVVYRTNPGNVETDGNDVFLGFFHLNVDGIFTNGSFPENDITSTTPTGDAAVNRGPAPTPTPTPTPDGKVTICHKGKNTLSVSANAASAHLAHGDSLGACGGSSALSGGGTSASAPTAAGSCGIGFELAFLMPGLMWLHRRRRPNACDADYRSPSSARPESAVRTSNSRQVAR